MSSVYSRDGVDRKDEDSFSAFAGEVCRATYSNSPYVEIHEQARRHFRGLRRFRLKNLPSDCWMDGGCDGIGTLCLIVGPGEACRDAGSHLIAMTFGDMTRHGRLPLMLFTNQLDVGSVGADGSATREACCALLRGLGDLAAEHQFVIYKGETAQMGIAIGSLDPDAAFKFMWSGTVLAAAHPEKDLDGDTLRPDHLLVALREPGFRACGMSTVRAALSRHLGPRYWESAAAKGPLRLAAAPAAQYDRFLAAVHGWFSPDFQPLVRMHGIVHLSGGSFRSKLAEDVLFPLGLSADLTHLWDAPPIAHQCKSWRGMSDRECYETWGCGQGVVVAVASEDDAERFIGLAETYGVAAKVCGKITHRATPSIHIVSTFTPGEMVEFP